MRGDHLPFDMLNQGKIGRELGIPRRFSDWVMSGRSESTGQVLTDAFQEIISGFEGVSKKKPQKLHDPLLEDEVLIGVYQLEEGAPLPPPTKTKVGEGEEREFSHDRRIVTCIQHPVHWAMVESRARQERYRLIKLFAVKRDQGASLLDPDAHAACHFFPAMSYKPREVDAALISRQFDTAHPTPLPARAPATPK